MTCSLQWSPPLHLVLKKVLLLALGPLFAEGGPAFKELKMLGCLGCLSNLDVSLPVGWQAPLCSSYGQSVRSLVASSFGPLLSQPLSLAEQVLHLFPITELSSLEEMQLLFLRHSCPLLDLLHVHWNGHLVRLSCQSHS